jgi:PII-like signaling protein
VNEDCLKLTIYFGERDRVEGGFLADTLTDIYATHELRTSLLLRGIEGFGIKHHLRTDRLLTLSEDLPLVSVAVDARPQIEAVLAEVNRLRFDGLVTLERARIPADLGAAVTPDEPTKLTVYVGRHERVSGRPAYLAVVDLLRRAGIAGATVLLGVDGTVHGVRRRARFFGRNANVPLMIISVGDGARIGAVLPELARLLPSPLVTLERARVLKRDGQRLADPHQLPETDASGLSVWQKLSVYAGGPVYQDLIRALRQAGAAGATALRAIWGYHGETPPHGDSVWQLRRGVPALTVIVDTPARIQRWFAVVDQVTREIGLVTSEMVPAFRATGPEIERGGLRLARL